jgi:hypothetical protein
VVDADQRRHILRQPRHQPSGNVLAPPVSARARRGRDLARRCILGAIDALSLQARVRDLGTRVFHTDVSREDGHWVTRLIQPASCPAARERGTGPEPRIAPSRTVPLSQPLRDAGQRDRPAGRSSVPNPGTWNVDGRGVTVMVHSGPLHPSGQARRQLRYQSAAWRGRNRSAVRSSCNDFR